MRGLRWLLVLAISAILIAVGSSYYLEKARQAREAPPPPPELPANITATSDTWIHTEYDGDQPITEVRATRMRQIREPSEFELEDVEIRLFHPGEAGSFDRVRSSHAVYDIAAGSLYSEGEVEITLDVPEGDGVEDLRLLMIRSSGVHFDTKRGKATTDQEASFRFSRGEGRSVGATYDPAWHDLQMQSEVELRWFGSGPHSEDMVVEAGHLVYKEDQSRIYLSPWSRFHRGGLTLEGDESVMTVEGTALRRVVTERAHGSTTSEGRRMDFEADRLDMIFGPSQAMEKIVGDKNARVKSTDAAAETQVDSDRIFLEFTQDGAESYLDHALAMGHGRLESRPTPRSAGRTPPTQILLSEVIKVILRPGGEVLKVLETHASTTAEFVPNSPGEPHRWLDGERVWLQYDEHNQLRSFRAAKARTRSEAPVDEHGKQPPPALTWSDDLIATFDPSTGEMVELKQWGNFRYEEGDRKATATTAVLQSKRNLIVLTEQARLWDPDGSTTADEIIIDQAEGRLGASGNVSSTRLMASETSSGGVLDPGTPVHATAQRMTAEADGSFIAYNGNVMMWQRANQIQGDRVEINRKRRTLKAIGNVVSRFEESREAKVPGDAGTVQVSTVVHSQELLYLEEKSSAHYRGAVHLVRPGLDIKSDELVAYFMDSEMGSPGAAEGGTRLDHARADGDVRITQRADDRVRTGLAEHAEYYLDEEKVFLSGGRPKLVDSVRGTTQGNQLTYFARSDRLLVDGADTRPAVSRIRKH